MASISILHNDDIRPAGRLGEAGEWAQAWGNYVHISPRHPHKRGQTRRPRRSLLLTLFQKAILYSLLTHITNEPIVQAVVGILFLDLGQVRVARVRGLPFAGGIKIGEDVAKNIGDSMEGGCAAMLDRERADGGMEGSGFEERVGGAADVGAFDHHRVFSMGLCG